MGRGLLSSPHPLPAGPFTGKCRVMGGRVRPVRAEPLAGPGAACLPCSAGAWGRLQPGRAFVFQVLGRLAGQRGVGERHVPSSSSQRPSGRG